MKVDSNDHLTNADFHFRSDALREFTNSMIIQNASGNSMKIPTKQRNAVVELNPIIFKQQRNCPDTFNDSFEVTEKSTDHHNVRLHQERLANSLSPTYGR